MADTEPKNTSQSDTPQETPQQQNQNPEQEQTAKPPIE
jgi:hypothetical protein